MRRGERRSEGKDETRREEGASRCTAWLCEDEKELREYDEQMSILFVTSSEEHLKEGYRVRLIQYLFKPVDREELM